MTEYKLDLYFLDNCRNKGPITHLGTVSFDGTVQQMLWNTFPEFPKSHWESEMSHRRENNGWWRDYWDGLYIRVQYKEKKSQGEWNYSRLWRPKEWMCGTTSRYEDAVKVANEFKKDFNRRMRG